MDGSGTNVKMKKGSANNDTISSSRNRHPLHSADDFWKNSKHYRYLPAKLLAMPAATGTSNFCPW
jgi:hypothetical protein